MVVTTLLSSYMQCKCSRHRQSCSHTAHRVSLQKSSGLFQKQIQRKGTEESKGRVYTCCSREPPPQPRARCWHPQCTFSQAVTLFLKDLICFCSPGSPEPQRLCQRRFQQLRSAVPARSTALAAGEYSSSSSQLSTIPSPHTPHQHFSGNLIPGGTR